MNLTEQIKRDEGLRYKAYQDTRGNWTIGYGHNLNKPISDYAAEVIFKQDLADAVDECLQAFPWASALSDRRWAVLVNLCYNLGLDGLLGFHDLLDALRHGEWDRAGRAILDSDAARALPLRYNRLALQMSTDQWQ